MVGCQPSEARRQDGTGPPSDSLVAEPPYDVQGV